MRCIGSILLLLLGSTFAAADDWPQWLGPNRDGASPEKVAPWVAPPRVAWRQTVGEGHSSPVIAGGKLFLHAKVADADAEEVTAYDAGTGLQQWRRTYPRPKFSSMFGNGPRATPAVSAGKLYTLGVTGILTCWDVNSGATIWQKDILQEFQAANLLFGVSCSPLVVDDKVFINVGGRGASVVAFAKDTGMVVWKSQDDKASYSSPIFLKSGSVPQVIFLTAEGVVSLKPSDGTVYWRYPLKDRLFESSTTPIMANDILVASSITFGSAGLRMQTLAGIPAQQEVWKQANLTCYFSTPVAVGADQLYMVTGTNPLMSRNPQATLRCVDPKNGITLWERPNVGKYHASLIRTGDNKLILLEDGGNLALVDPSVSLYKELARSKVCGETWAHPALANGKLYIRDARELICLQMAP